MGLEAYRFTAKETTKETLLKIHSPYILHLATHGFFAKEDPTSTQTEPGALLNDRQSVTKSKFFKNPMHRSGLALAGAQTTIVAWERGEVPPQARPKHSSDCTCIHDTAGNYSALPNAFLNR